MVEKNNKLGFLFDAVCSSPIYHYALRLRIKSYIKKIGKTKNFNIIIESTNICNARCIMCPYTKMRRKREVMSDDTFDLIIERVKEDTIRPLCFIVNGFGEPFTDRKIIERIQALRKSFPQSKIKLYSNFSIISEHKIKKLVSSGLDEINISFNGVNKKNYEETMGINYDKTKRNLEHLLYMRDKLNKNLKIRMSMTLVEGNQADSDKYISHWRERVDSVSVNRVHTYGGAVNDVSGDLGIKFSKKPIPCKYLWNTVVIGVRGDIFLCCLDYDGVWNFGNIKGAKILAIFHSRKFKAVRNLHLSGKIDSMDICKRCYTPYKNGVEWWVDNLY